MFKVTCNGIPWRKWWNELQVQKRRRAFVKQELKPGQMTIMWLDVDENVYGWTMAADNEIELLKVAALISQVKHEKLVQTVNGGKNG